MKKLKLITLLTSLIINGVALADLNTGLVAHWNFDDCTAKDVSGNGHDGIINGNPQCIPSPMGKSLKLNGLTDYIQGSIGSDTFSANWTIVAKFNRDSYNSAWDAIFSNSLTTTDAVVMTFKGMNSNFLGMNRVGIEDAGPYVNLGSNHFNKWVFAVLSMTNGTLNIQANVNGKIYKNSYKRTAPIKTEDSFLIGKHWNADITTSTLFKGSIDDVIVYNRPLLSSEIAEIYNAGLSVNGTINSLATHTVVCKNETTGQIVNIASNKATVYDCEAKGLKVNTGETASVFIKGIVQ